MKIAVLSDTHDNIWKLATALEMMAGADALIHCGDLCSPFMIARLGEHAGGAPVHIVWGNNEGDIRLLTRTASSFPALTLHDQFASIEIDDVRVAVNHYPEIAQPIAKSGDFDLVCYGHDHTAHQSMVGNCTLLNPGELMGLRGRTTFAWFDTQTRSVEFVQVD